MKIALPTNRPGSFLKDLKNGETFVFESNINSSEAHRFMVVRVVSNERVMAMKSTYVLQKEQEYIPAVDLEKGEIYYFNPVSRVVPFKITKAEGKFL